MYKKYSLALFALCLWGCHPAPEPIQPKIDAPVREIATPRLSTPPPVIPVIPVVTPKPVATPTLLVKPLPSFRVSTPELVTPRPATPAPATPLPSKIMFAEKGPAFVIDKDDVPVLTPEGLGLIVEYEVGGERQYRHWPHPEYSGGVSGVTWGIGYDAHQNTRTVILSDWAGLGDTPVTRLAATQPYYGKSAKIHYKDVVDITVPWEISIDVFIDIDVSRTDAQCRKAFPGFDSLRPHAKDAIRSLVFNRGTAMAGPNRSEMRWMRDKGVPNKDYEGLAKAERDMKRIWRGTSIQDGMYRRREAEAKLFETP